MIGHVHVDALLMKRLMSSDVHLSGQKAWHFKRKWPENVTCIHAVTCKVTAFSCIDVCTGPHHLPHPLLQQHLHVRAIRAAQHPAALLHLAAPTRTTTTTTTMMTIITMVVKAASSVVVGLGDDSSSR